MSSPMLAIAWFDFVRRLRMVSTYVYFVLFAVLAGLWMAAAGGALSSASVNFGGDKVLINGPYALAFGIAFLGLRRASPSSARSRAAPCSRTSSTARITSSSRAPISKADYFFGRLLGAWLTLVLVFAEHRARHRDRQQLAGRGHRAHRRASVVRRASCGRTCSC